jgi:integrase
MDILSIDKDKRGLQEFRVTFRMRMHERGMPEDYIEYLLRHSTTKLMQNYYTDYKIIEDKIREFLNKKV